MHGFYIQPETIPPRDQWLNKKCNGLRRSCKNAITKRVGEGWLLEGWTAVRKNRGKSVDERERSSPGGDG